MSQAFEIGLWIFSGIVAGALVQYFLAWVSQKLNYKKSLKNLVFELQYNISQIEEFQETAKDLRNKINANQLNTFFGYFAYSRLLWVTAQNMLAWGTLYDSLNNDEMKQLIEISNIYCPAGESFPNKKVQELQENYIHADAVRYVDFLDAELKKHKDTLSAHIIKLKK